MLQERVDLYRYFSVKRGKNSSGYLNTYVPDGTPELNVKKRPAMLICTGGGYGFLSDREKEPVAIRFLSKGYSSFTLEYTVKTAYPVPFLEACMAMIYIRENAEKYFVDRNHVCAVGFSAGGHLAAMLATLFAEKEVKAVLGERNARPDAVILSYPVITADPRFWHEGSIRTISGEDEKLAERLSAEKRVTKNSVPAFIWHTAEDDGVPVEKEIRYTYSPYSFFLGEDLSKISDGYREHAFYSPERTVTQYTFVAETAETGDLDAVFFIPADEDTRVLLSEYANKTVQGGEEVGIDVKNGEEISFLVIGEKDFLPEGTLYRGFPGNYAEKVPGTLTMVKSSKMTFEEFVFSSFSLPEGKFARNDWYNAAVDYLDSNRYDGSVVWTGEAYNFADSLLRWYEYDLTVPAGGRTVNRVSAPLYPSIDADYSPAVYSYEYLLSPAASWADFGTLEISINTPYYLLWHSGKFTAKEGGYAYFSDSLPQGELVFSLCESENPEWQNNGSWWLGTFIVVGGVVAAILLVAEIAGLIVLIVFAVKALTAKN